MRTGYILSLVVFLVVCGWLVSLSPRTTRQIQSAGLALVTPFLRAGSEVERTAREFRESVRSEGELARENEQLRREVKLAQLYARDRKEVYEENRRLAGALEYAQRSPFDLLPARVVQRDRTTWWSTVVVDRGFNQNVAVGAAVLVPEGLVGRVLTVAPESSVVLLLTDERCQVAARTLGSRDLQGVVSGARGNTESSPLLRMGPLPQGTKAGAGRAVITTGSGGVFPPNFPVGAIERIEDRDFFSEAVVRPAADFDRLDQVFVVVSPGGGQ